MARPFRLAALVVLFHPRAEHLDRLCELPAQRVRVLAVDNAPVPDHAAARRLRPHGIVVLHNGNQNGIAGGFNRGLAALFTDGADGADGVVLLDQDSVVPAGFFDTLAAFADGQGGRPLLAGPRILDEATGRFLPELAAGGLAVRRLRLGDGPEPGEGEREGTGPATQPRQQAHRCAFLISSGCLITRAAYDRLGPFDAALFIDHVDTEYCLRALARDVALYVLPALVLRHRIGAGSRHRLGPLAVTTLNHAWPRRYYSARNAVHLAVRYGVRQRIAWVPTLLTFWQMLLIALFERDKARKLAAMLYGALDGLRGRLGAIEQSRPGLFVAPAARPAPSGARA